MKQDILVKQEKSFLVKFVGRKVLMKSKYFHFMVLYEALATFFQALLRHTFFECLFGEYLVEFFIFVHKFLEAFGGSHLHAAIFVPSPIKSLHTNIFFMTDSSMVWLDLG